MAADLEHSLLFDIGAVFPSADFGIYGAPHLPPTGQPYYYTELYQVMPRLPPGAYDNFDWTHPEHFFSDDSSDSSDSSYAQMVTIVLNFFVQFTQASAADFPALGVLYVNAISNYTGKANRKGRKLWLSFANRHLAAMIPQFSACWPAHLPC